MMGLRCLLGHAPRVAVLLFAVSATAFHTPVQVRPCIMSVAGVLDKNAILENARNALSLKVECLRSALVASLCTAATFH